MGISSPLLKQAGFAQSALSLPAYLYRSDGASQYYSIEPPIVILSGDKIGFDFIGGAAPGAYKRFLYFNEYNFSVDTGVSGDVFRLISATARLDGENISSGNTKIPSSGFHSFDVTCLVDGTLSTLLSAYQEHLMNLPIFNFYVERQGVKIHEIPLNNLRQDAYQIAQLGSSNAKAINYLSGNWESLNSNKLLTWYNKSTGLVYPNIDVLNYDEVIR